MQTREMERIMKMFATWAQITFVVAVIAGKSIRASGVWLSQREPRRHAGQIFDSVSGSEVMSKLRLFLDRFRERWQRDLYWR